MAKWLQYTRRPKKVFAVRYGTETLGDFYPEAADQVARFLLGLEKGAHIPPQDLLSVLRPAQVQAWKTNPRNQLAVLEVYHIQRGLWLTLHPGQMVVLPPDLDLHIVNYADFIDEFAPFRSEPLVIS